MFHESAVWIFRNAYKAKLKNYRGMVEVNRPEKIQVREKDWSQQVEHMQVPNGPLDPF